MTPAERRRVARVLREAARIVAEGDRWGVDWNGACDAICRSCVDLRDEACDAFDVLLRPNSRVMFYWPLDEEHRSVRVIALLLTAEAVLTGDCE